MRRKEKQDIICNLFDFYAPIITPRETSIQETRFSLQGVVWHNDDSTSSVRAKKRTAGLDDRKIARSEAVEFVE